MTIQQHTIDVEYLESRIRQLETELSRALARNAELERNTARWQAISECHHDWDIGYEYVEVRIPCDCDEFDSLDEVIDAHIAAMSATTGEGE